ncbi:MAG: restriction endonuclease [Mesonia hippocampi]|uniref:Restriction system protein n=1 Tax=Mesonia hippocampi TaxID=1628250 RepID=A0A840EI06_9FLAO|nr:restriction endonuclease [Mesonia hippocampi]MBB4117798.1 restriction system protein [Mesonia hippocampi]
MSKIIFSTRDFYDSTTEYIGIKSGILLNRIKVKDILTEQFKDDFLIKDDLNSGFKIYVDDYEDMLVYIRKRIGNLPKISIYKNDLEKVINYVHRTRNIDLFAKSTSICNYYLNQTPTLSNQELAQILEEKENYPKEISLEIANIGIERIDQSCVLPTPSKNWDGIKKLSDLFDCELVAENENEFLDQRFIDYLATNGNEVELIHWRNFERFCAEYFNKLGQKVILGSGTNDGGVDIRVFDPENSSKPLILIQCKRYKKENKISIETVKSFYTDVLFENAEKGLIATSSYIAPGGKKVRNSRGYNIDFAEFENVKKWAKEMWKYKK